MSDGTLTISAGNGSMTASKEITVYTPPSKNGSSGGSSGSGTTTTTTTTTTTADGTTTVSAAVTGSTGADGIGSAAATQKQTQDALAAAGKRIDRPGYQNNSGIQSEHGQQGYRHFLYHSANVI